MIGLRRLLRNFSRDRRGSLLAEMAVTLSILTTLSLSGVELARYTLLHQKMERISASIGDLIAQAETLTETDVLNVFDAIGEVARPFAMGTNGVVIISSVSASEGSGPVLNWQRTGGGTLGLASQIATTPGAPAALPAGLTVIDGETVIVAEVMYDYAPWLYDAVIGATQLYHTAYFRPRLGTLTTVDPG
jgi:Flp pilus assembly protein TadG